MSPKPSLYNQESVVMARDDEPRKGSVPTMKVLRCADTAVSRVFRSERQNGLPGLGKVWKPTPVVRDHRKVTRESVV